MYNFKDKRTNLQNMNRYLLAKTGSMFEYENLPDTIPSIELEKLLQQNGYAFITEVKGELYAFSGHLGGEQDVYGNPKNITINNVALNFNEILDVEEDGVLICNDSYLMGLLPLFNRYNFMLVENDINMILHGYNTRLQTMISAGDDRTKESAQLYVDKMIEGDISVIGESPMFEGVKMQTGGANSSNPITALTEFHQYIKGSLFNEIGLNANFNMKRERLNTAEIETNDDTLYPFVDNMMENRLKAVEKINEKYDMEISIDYGSVWNKKNKEMVDDIVTAETASEDGEQPEEETEVDVTDTSETATGENSDDAEGGEETEETEETSNETSNETSDETEDETEGVEEWEEENETLSLTSLSELSESSLNTSEKRIEEIEFSLENDVLSPEEREELETELAEHKEKINNDA